MRLLLGMVVGAGYCCCGGCVVVLMGLVEGSWCACAGCRRVSPLAYVHMCVRSR